MYFAHDTEQALLAAAALVNSELTDAAALVDLLDAHEYSGRRDGTAAELADVRALAVELAGLWRTADAGQLVPGVNALLARTEARPHLVRHDGWDWHLHVTDGDAPLVDRMGAEAAMALVDVVRGGDLHRLRHCAAEDCDAVLVDLSRNSSRRYCDTGNCGNRAHVAAYRARRRST